jgi:hypothetical protein
MIRQVALAATTLALVCGATVASAQDSRFAIALRSVEYSLSPNFVACGSFDALKFGREETYDDIDYNAEVDFSSPALFLDWHLTGTPCSCRPEHTSAIAT